MYWSVNAKVKTAFWNLNHKSINKHDFLLDSQNIFKLIPQRPLMSQRARKLLTIIIAEPEKMDSIRSPPTSFMADLVP